MTSFGPGFLVHVGRGWHLVTWIQMVIRLGINTTWSIVQVSPAECRRGGRSHVARLPSKASLHYAVRFCKVSKPRGWALKRSHSSEILQAILQQCCRDACKISERYDHFNTQFHGFETNFLGKTSYCQAGDVALSYGMLISQSGWLSESFVMFRADG